MSERGDLKHLRHGGHLHGRRALPQGRLRQQHGAVRRLSAARTSAEKCVKRRRLCARRPRGSPRTPSWRSGPRPTRCRASPRTSQAPMAIPWDARTTAKRTNFGGQNGCWKEQKTRNPSRFRPGTHHAKRECLIRLDSRSSSFSFTAYNSQKNILISREKHRILHHFITNCAFVNCSLLHWSSSSCIDVNKLCLDVIKMKYEDVG